MTPLTIFSREGHTIYLGDCLDILPQMGRKADLLICDVAYDLTSGGGAFQSMGGIFATQNYDNSGKLFHTVPWEDLGGPFFRACKEDCDAYIMSNDKHIGRAQIAFLGAGWNFHNLLVWDKVRATRNRWYMKNLEFTLYFWKGRSDPLGIANCGSKQLFTLNAKKVSAHQTEKPVPLIEHYIRNSSGVGEVVLDPMCGSGTTLVAAVRSGRKSIGIERDPKWFEIACQRLNAALDGDPNA